MVTMIVVVDTVNNNQVDSVNWRTYIIAVNTDDLTNQSN